MAIQGLVDRIFHNAIPVFASLILVAGGAGLIAGAAFAPFAVAGSERAVCWSPESTEPGAKPSAVHRHSGLISPHGS